MELKKIIPISLTTTRATTSICSQRRRSASIVMSTMRQTSVTPMN